MKTNKIGPMTEERTAGDEKKLYDLVDMHGFGRLTSRMRVCQLKCNYDEIDSLIMQFIPDFLINQGRGKVFPISELVKLRNQERNSKLGAFSRSKGKGKSGPNILDDFDQNTENAGDLQKALKLLDGGGKGGKGETKYRELCWKLEERGSMGETIIGVCLLHATSVHNLLAIRILNLFPKLINDVNISEDYYGLSPLHQAIINLDTKMVSRLLHRGADVNQRCYGAFFNAEDQKANRQDSLEHEYVDLSLDTNYAGKMYFGEYPLSFAVCLNQFDILRLLLLKKANINAQDTNGNTALHLCVIHEKMEMLDILLEEGASLDKMNKQNLTPLTLAAKLGKLMMFNTILDLECEKVWLYGDAACISYPLAKIDTINERTGQINEASALSLVVYGEKREHLDFLSGLLDDILTEKWKAYGKRRWFISLIAFVFYYIVFTSAYMLRPFSATTEHITQGMISRFGQCTNDSLSDFVYQNEAHQWDPISSQCHLLEYWQWDWHQGWFRLLCEILVVLFVIIQLAMDVLDIRRIGKEKWFSIIRSFPAKILFKVSFILVLLIVPTRLSCSLYDGFLYVENALATLAVIFTTLHFLYFLRAVPFVGPFVLMVYTIIATDLSRFILIYSIFLVGFSQSFYMIFHSCEGAAERNREAGVFTEFENVIQNPIDAFIRTFIMTIGEFGALYREMSACDAVHMRYIGKIMFMVFEVCVSILQFNLLIAMMTRTYETIFQTRKEWKRQWAQVILMVEMSLAPHDRLLAILKYSRPTGTNKQKRSFVVKKRATFEHTEEEALKVREEKAEKLREEKRELLNKRQKEQEIRVNALKVMEKVVGIKKRRFMMRQSTVQ